MKLLIFGAGENYWLYRKWFCRHDVLAVVDNAVTLYHHHIDGHLIISPQEIDSCLYDRIYIISSYVVEIRQQLLSCHVSEEKIFYTYNLIDLGEKPKINKFWPAHYLFPGKGQRHVLMISHDFSVTGAPNCLLYAAAILIKAGYIVTVVSPSEGEIRESFLQIGAEAIVDERLLVGDILDSSYCQNYDALFVNTIQLFYLLRHRNIKMRTIWWVHEPLALYKYVPDDFFHKLPPENLEIYAVSDLARQAFHRHWKDIQVQLLPFGVNDLSAAYPYEGVNDKIRFVIIGEVSYLKGYDILLQAVEKISMVKGYEVVCIGPDATEFAQSIKNTAVKNRINFQFLGKLAHDKTMEVLSQSDIVVCASREETMSMSIIEGLMFGKVCITTDQTGIAKYFVDGENGFVCTAGDVVSLSMKMQYVLEHLQQFDDLRRQARKTYEQYFSMSIFENNFLALIQRKSSLS